MLRKITHAMTNRINLAGAVVAAPDGGGGGGDGGGGGGGTHCIARAASSGIAESMHTSRMFIKA